MKRFLVLAVLLVLGIGLWLARRPNEVRGPVVRLDTLPGPVAEILRDAEAGVRQDPRSAAAWGHWGMVLMAHDMPVEAITCLQQAEQLEPLPTESFTARGSQPFRWAYYQGMCLGLSDPAAALACFQRAAEFEGVPPVVRLELAERLLTLQRLDEAEVQLRDPDVPLDGSRGDLARGRLAFLRGDFGTSGHWLKGVIGSNPKNRDARQLLSQVLLRLEDPAGAAEQSRLCRELGSQRAAWDDPFMNAVVALCRSPSQLLSHAEELVAQDNYPAAADILRRVLDLAPNQPDVLVQLGFALMRQGDQPAAAAALRAALALNPAHAEAHYYLGSLQMQEEKWSEAVASLQQAVQFKPDYAAAQHNLGTCLIRLNKPTAAATALQAAVRAEPDSTASHLSLAELLIASGQPAEAARHLEAVRRLAPADPRLNALLAKVKAAADKGTPGR